jgi:hypothetical protein
LTAEAVLDEREANITLYYSRIREVCIHQCIYIFFAILQHVFLFIQENAEFAYDYAFRALNRTRLEYLSRGTSQL